MSLTDAEFEDLFEAHLDHQTELAMTANDSDHETCQCAGEPPVFSWPGDGGWWSCSRCDRRVRPWTSQERNLCMCMGGFADCKPPFGQSGGCSLSDDDPKTREDA